MSKLTAFIFFILYSFPAFAGSKVGLSALLDSTETMVFIVFILGFTGYLLTFKFNRFTLNHAPEILTTIGIFGCFYGIAKALLYFDSSDLNNSVPLLLDGIKTAFCVSLAGVFGALIIKFAHLFRKKPIPQPEGASRGANIDDLVSAIHALQKNLIGNEEGTLLAQIKLLRQDSNDWLQKLNNSFEKFSAHMVENNQKAIIEALQHVITDFNRHLTEQFGDNFKQLNHSVENLVIWQQQYKDELNAIKQMQIQTASDMKIASEAFKTLVNKSEHFSSVSEKLGVILNAISKQKDTLFEQEKALSELLIQMKNVTPEFANKLGSMLNDLAAGVKQVQSETADVIKNFGAQAQSANAEMKNLLTEVLTKSHQQLSEGLQENSKIIKEGVLTLDKALQKELNDSLTSLGKQLASLSEKFVEDYQPLTDRLREVVRLAANV